MISLVVVGAFTLATLFIAFALWWPLVAIGVLQIVLRLLVAFFAGALVVFWLSVLRK